MRTRDPNGHRWTVRRRWAPWAGYFQGPLNRLNQPLGDEIGDHWSGVAASFGRATAVPLITSLLSWVLLALLWPFAVLTRVVLRRPWPVETRRAGEPWRSDVAPSFAAAAELIQGHIDDISYGRIPPRTTRALEGDNVTGRSAWQPAPPRLT